MPKLEGLPTTGMDKIEITESGISKLLSGPDELPNLLLKNIFLPQGTVLGTILMLCYINDPSSVLSDFDSLLTTASFIGP